MLYALYSVEASSLLCEASQDHLSKARPSEEVARNELRIRLMLSRPCAPQTTTASMQLPLGTARDATRHLSCAQVLLGRLALLIQDLTSPAA